ncbi:hypothetical protein KAR91_58840, partial [Candidatus Pacearchaeota archaeon]|nr:hypothetical protein [Candidatus Pacearchaeota archaeon]
ITAAAGYALADLTLQSPITLSADSLVSGSIGKTYSATNGNTVTVVWEQYDSGVMGIFSSVYNEGGGWSSPHQLSTNGSLPSIVATSSGYVSTWAEDSGIMVNRYTDATGSWDANPVQAYDSAGTRVEALAIAQGNSEFMLAWSAPAPLDILATSSSSDALSWGLPSMLATSSGNDLRLISDGLGYLMSTNGLFAIYHHDGTQWDMTPSQLSFNPVQNYELESNGSSYAVIVTGGYTHVYENGTWTPRIMLDFSTGCYSNDIISIESTSYGYIALWGDDFGSGSYQATCIADFDNTGWLSSPNRFEPVMSGPLRENNGGYNIIHTVTDPATGEIDLASAYYINGKTGRSAGLIDNTTGNPLKDSIELHVINSGRISAKYVSNNNGETSLWGIGGR